MRLSLTSLVNKLHPQIACQLFQEAKRKVYVKVAETFLLDTKEITVVNVLNKREIAIEQHPSRLILMKSL